MQLELISTTFPEGKKSVCRRCFSCIPDPGAENEVVNLYPEIEYQTIEGFGGAFTDSAASVFSLMSEAAQRQLLDAYFDPKKGAGYTLGRIHLDSCDFSLEHFEAVSDPQDTAFKSFSLSRWGRYLLPFIQAAEKTRGKPLTFIAAPWSPPAFMKTTGKRNNGGALREAYREAYAKYLGTYLLALRKAGIEVRRVTVQNEPLAVQQWDSCVYTAEEEKQFIRDFLSPTLRAMNLGEVELFIWDHNKERVYERTRDILDQDTDALIRGVAFHWYSGDHFEALRLIREQFPEKILIHTESCLEYSRLDKGDQMRNAQKYAHDLIGDLNNGVSAFYDWNLVLDEQGGPNHVRNFCDAPFLFHRDTGELEERPSFAHISHFSRYIHAGAKGIAFSRYTGLFEMTAFRNTDGTITAVFLNPTDKPLPVQLRLRGNVSTFSLLPQSIATGILRP
ncbi:MAG: glucosylceramidase [Treponema sp.]|jgi:glucosylceramidase|nr:glucosylceramidase [Treponema sp.]